MHQHRKYDSTIPWLFLNNKENLLDDAFRKSIPRSTIADWKNKGFDGYYGGQYRAICAEALDREIILQDYKNLRKTMNGLIRVWVSMSEVLIPLLHSDKKRSAWLVEHTQQLKRVLPKKTALQLMGFKNGAFHYRITSLLACTGSGIGQCIKRNTKQLSSIEIHSIKELFADAKFSCWPMSSMYYHGLNEGTLNIGLSTFYKYAKLLNLSRKFRKPVDRKKGIHTTAPNQYLHIDTTYWNTLDTGFKAAIVFASDNFSRFITGFTVAERNSAVNVAETIQQTINTMLRYHPDHQCVTHLIADGGSENHAITITELLEKTKRPLIQKLIAKKDIQFSNSPIEAINKICKRYLRHYKPSTLQELKVIIALFVHDYNTVRPHGKLKGLTPLQAYQNQQPTDFKPQIRQAKAERIALNKTQKCGLSC